VEFDSDYIETFLCVNPKKREKMMVCPSGGNARDAVTFYEVLDRFAGFTYVRLFPKTGRTHQLRVHMQHLGHPIVADRLYGGRSRLLLSDVARGDASGNSLTYSAAPGEAGDDPVLLTRQALHALRLEFRHPRSGEPLAFESPLPEDFRGALAALQSHR
jgi:23S rRNA pseudouridine1911/1915/1917 synthase